MKYFLTSIFTLGDLAKLSKIWRLSKDEFLLTVYLIATQSVNEYSSFESLPFYWQLGKIYKCEKRCQQVLQKNINRMIDFSLLAIFLKHFVWSGSASPWILENEVIWNPDQSFLNQSMSSHLRQICVFVLRCKKCYRVGPWSLKRLRSS